MSRIYRATMMMTASDGTLMEPSVHYRTDVPPAGDEPSPDDVADAINTKIQAALRAILSAADTYNDLVVREMVIPPDIGVVGVAHQGSVGNLTTADDFLPRGVVPIFNVHSGTSSRSSRGHFCGPSPSRTGVFKSGRLWSTTYQALCQTLADLLNDTMDLGSVFPTHLIPVVYSRTRHLRDTPPFSFDVTNVSVNQVPHWLRSRQSSP